jgi:hypothetical protein
MPPQLAKRLPADHEPRHRAKPLKPNDRQPTASGLDRHMPTTFRKVSQRPVIGHTDATQLCDQIERDFSVLLDDGWITARRTVDSKARGSFQWSGPLAPSSVGPMKLSANAPEAHGDVPRLNREGWLLKRVQSRATRLDSG